MGVTPLMDYKYWSAAMREGGKKSLTLVTHHYPAHRREDYDFIWMTWIPMDQESVLAFHCG